MSASRIDGTSVTPGLFVESPDTRFHVPPHCACVRPSGVEFQSPQPFPLWAEMTVSLQTPRRRSPIRCTGVVVACDGNRHSGYAVSLLFLNLSRLSEEHLRSMAGAVSA